MLNKFDTAIFDMDGTLLDSLSVWDKIDYDFFEKKRGIKVPDDYVHVIAAMSFKETVKYTIERFNLSETPEQIAEEFNAMALYEYSNNIVLKEGAYEYLELLKSKGKKIVLCTSSPEIFYVPALKNNGIYDMFDAFTNTCEAGIGKGQPDVFLLAAKKSNTDPCRCIVFEDVLEAAESAKKANMLVCGVYDRRNELHRTKMEELCDIYIKSFKELLI